MSQFLPVWVNLKTTYRSIVSFSLIPTFPTSSLSTETGSCRQQGEVLQLYVVSNSKVSLSRLVGIASGRSSLRACRVVICITLPPLRWLTEQKNPKSLRSLQNAQRDTTNLAVNHLFRCDDFGGEAYFRRELCASKWVSLDSKNSSKH